VWPGYPQAWTFHSRAAIVIGVTERNAPVADRVKLHRLRQLLIKLVERQGDAAVSVEQVRQYSCAVALHHQMVVLHTVQETAVCHSAAQPACICFAKPL
jgi:hypothetical protein